MSKTDPADSAVTVVLAELLSELYGIGGLVTSMPHIVCDEVSAANVGKEILRRVNGLRDLVGLRMLQLSGDLEIQVTGSRQDVTMSTERLDAALGSLRLKEGARPASLRSLKASRAK